MTRRLHVVVAVLGVLLIGSGAQRLPAQNLSADGAMQTFNYLADHFFSDVYFKFSPTNGTAAGLHQYDSQLEDYSAAAVQEEIAALHGYEKKVAAIDPSALDAPVAGGPRDSAEQYPVGVADAGGDPAVGEESG